MMMMMMISLMYCCYLIFASLKYPCSYCPVCASCRLRLLLPDDFVVGSLECSFNLKERYNLTMSFSVSPFEKSCLELGLHYLSISKQAPLSYGHRKPSSYSIEWLYLTNFVLYTNLRHESLIFVN